MKLLCAGWISVRNFINFDLAVFLYSTRIFDPAVFLYNTKTGFKHLTTSKISFKKWILSISGRQDDKLHTVDNNAGITQRSISCSGVKIWNDLPKNIRDAQSVDVFKTRLKEHLFNQNRNH